MWWSLYYFFCKCSWSTTWNSRSKFYSNFFSNNGNNKKLLRITKNKKKKHNKIFMLAKSKLNSIKNLVSQALIDMEISNEEFITIMKEKKDARR